MKSLGNGCRTCYFLKLRGWDAQGVFVFLVSTSVSMVVLHLALQFLHQACLDRRTFFYHLDWLSLCNRSRPLYSWRSQHTVVGAQADGTELWTRSMLTWRDKLRLNVWLIVGTSLCWIWVRVHICSIEDLNLDELTWSCGLTTVAYTCRSGWSEAQVAVEAPICRRAITCVQMLVA